ncbi:MAG TPA: hypothetical protein VHX88_04790 [Solirubrobacteraceae bacterium]|jgi:hypothetical protein|nr:hypothetical protein [Solirubrobacteraceae bacterium]
MTITSLAGPRRWSLGLWGGGTDGNEQLTSITGAILLVLLAVLGVTIVRIGQLLWLHLFLGLALIGPVTLKLASTGYRFVRYYAGNAAYREKGPPPAALRGLAPFVVASTLVVFVTGVLLLIEGPAHRSTLALVHKVSFFVWLAVTGLHVLGHLLDLPRSMRAVRRNRPRIAGLPEAGGAGRVIALAGALVGGLLLAAVLIPDFHAWTSAHLHHHHHR